MMIWCNFIANRVIVKRECYNTNSPGCMRLVIPDGPLGPQHSFAKVHMALRCQYHHNYIVLIVSYSNLYIIIANELHYILIQCNKLIIIPFDIFQLI